MLKAKKIASLAIVITLYSLVLAPSVFAKTQGYGKAQNIWSGITDSITTAYNSVTYKVRDLEEKKAYTLVIRPSDDYMDDLLLLPYVSLLDQDGNILSASSTTVYQNQLGAYTTMVFRANAKMMQINVTSLTGDTGYFHITLMEAQTTPLLVAKISTSQTLQYGYVDLANFGIYGSDVNTTWKQISFTVLKNGVEFTNLSLVNPKTNNIIAGEFTQTNDKLVFTATNEQFLNYHSGQDYTIRAMVTKLEPNSYLQLGVKSSNTKNITGTYTEVADSGASFVWSDISEAGHSEYTPDWHNDASLQNLPIYFPVIMN